MKNDSEQNSKIKYDNQLSVISKTKISKKDPKIVNYNQQEIQPKASSTKLIQISYDSDLEFDYSDKEISDFFRSRHMSNLRQSKQDEKIGSNPENLRTNKISTISDKTDENRNLIMSGSEFASYLIC